MTFSKATDWKSTSRIAETGLTPPLTGAKQAIQPGTWHSSNPFPSRRPSNGPLHLQTEGNLRGGGPVELHLRDALRQRVLTVRRSLREVWRLPFLRGGKFQSEYRIPAQRDVFPCCSRGPLPYNLYRKCLPLDTGWKWRGGSVDCAFTSFGPGEDERRIRFTLCSSANRGSALRERSTVGPFSGRRVGRRTIH